MPQRARTAPTRSRAPRSRRRRRSAFQVDRRRVERRAARGHWATSRRLFCDSRGARLGKERRARRACCGVARAASRERRTLHRIGCQLKRRRAWNTAIVRARRYAGGRRRRGAALCAGLCAALCTRVERVLGRSARSRGSGLALTGALLAFGVSIDTAAARRRRGAGVLLIARTDRSDRVLRTPAQLRRSRAPVVNEALLSRLARGNSRRARAPTPA